MSSSSLAESILLKSFISKISQKLFNAFVLCQFIEFFVKFSYSSCSISLSFFSSINMLATLLNTFVPDLTAVLNIERLLKVKQKKFHQVNRKLRNQS